MQAADELEALYERRLAIESEPAAALWCWAHTDTAALHWRSSYGMLSPSKAVGPAWCLCTGEKLAKAHAERDDVRFQLEEQMARLKAAQIKELEVCACLMRRRCFIDADPDPCLLCANDLFIIIERCDGKTGGFAGRAPGLATKGDLRRGWCSRCTSRRCRAGALPQRACPPGRLTSRAVPRRL